VSLVVKRLQQRICLVDQVLNALRRRIFTSLRGGDPQRKDGERRAERGDADAETDPKEHACEPALFAVVKTFGIGAVIGGLHVSIIRAGGAPFFREPLLRGARAAAPQ
jgi:hypothetical protein